MKLVKLGIIMSRVRTTTEVEISNESTSANITNVTVGGVAITDITFPITPGNNAIGITNQMGTKTIIVFYNNASGDSVVIEDTELNIICANATGSSRAFAGQITNGTLPNIVIIIQDGACS